MEALHDNNSFTNYFGRLSVFQFKCWSFVDQIIGKYQFLNSIHGEVSLSIIEKNHNEEWVASRLGREPVAILT